MLRAFEAGADLVGIVACARDNCHYLEGSARAARRSAFVGALLEEIGLGAGRLMLFQLPGSAREDMAAGAPLSGPARICDPRLNEELSGRIKDIAAQVAARLQELKPNPLHAPVAAAEVPVAVEALEAEDTEDNDE
jgi:hypothetical protein